MKSLFLSIKKNAPGLCVYLPELYLCSMKKFIISGGGTGGHIYPGIAIAHSLRELSPDCDILFVGAKGKMEMEKVPKEGFPIEGLSVRGLQRRLTLKNLSVPFRLADSLWNARKILRSFKPDAVIGTGGYASAAIGKAAVWQKIPVFLQEQNGYAGLTNKMLANDAQKIFVAYPDMERFFPKEKIKLTGNPVRAGFSDENTGDKNREDYSFFGLSPEKKTLLVLGGSLGARTLNNSLLHTYEMLTDAGFQIIWQTGKLYISELRKQVEGREGLYMNDFIYEMPKAYRCADLVLARAGALTVSELALMQKATVFIPSPNVAENHQFKNAEALQKKSAAGLITDREASEKVLPTVLSLLGNDKERSKMAENIKNFAYPEAAKNIAEDIIRNC